MSRYKAYPEYKDSGVEWLDKVPTQWQSVPIKYTALCPSSLFLDGDWIESKDISGDEIRYITTGNVGEGFYREQGVGFISEEKFVELDCTEVLPGDILISRLNAPIGRSCIVPELESRIVTSVDNVIYRPDSIFDRKFLVHLFSSADYFAHTANLARGATMQRISRGLLGNIRIVVPSHIEQQKIANFLDHETAKIDTLIAKQQELIKLLKEKRQAVISHAVTKGLNPNAPMRDSGVEWLGEVPAHWEVEKLRYLGECQNGINIGAESFGSGFPFISYGDVYKNEILPKEASGLVESSEKDKELYSVKYGDVFFTRTSETIEEIGFASTCLKTIENATFAGFLIRFRPVGQTLDPEFSKFYFRSNLLRVFFVKEMNLVTRASLSQDLLKKLPVPVPPLSEQKDVAQFLDGRVAMIAKLIEDAENAIALMQERRSALISAAVTGKIDVRDWQPPASEAQAA